jgi:hypothetical protein
MAQLDPIERMKRGNPRATPDRENKVTEQLKPITPPVRTESPQACSHAHKRKGTTGLVVCSDCGAIVR